MLRIYFTLSILLFCVVSLFSQEVKEDKTKKIINFSKLKIVESGNTYTIFDTSVVSPIQLCPLATIDNIGLDIENNYAFVTCLNRYFIINKYGEMSAGFEKEIEQYDYKNNIIFGSKYKKDKANGLYDFNGNEIGKLSKSRWVKMYEEKVTHLQYYIFENSKHKLGLVNAKGELLLECKYNGLYPNENGNFDVYLDQDEDLFNVDPLTLKPLPWGK